MYCSAAIHVSDRRKISKIFIQRLNSAIVKISHTRPRPLVQCTIHSEWYSDRQVDRQTDRQLVAYHIDWLQDLIEYQYWPRREQEKRQVVVSVSSMPGCTRPGRPAPWILQQHTSDAQSSRHASQLTGLSQLLATFNPHLDTCPQPSWPDPALITRCRPLQRFDW